MLQPDPVIILILQPLVQLIGKGDRTVLAAGAADGDHQLILALQDIVGNQKTDHIIQLVQENMRHIKAHDKVLNRLVIAGELSELLIVVGIRKKTHSEYQVGIAGDPVLEAEGKHGDHQIPEFPVLIYYHP